MTYRCTMKQSLFIYKVFKKRYKLLLILLVVVGVSDITLSFYNNKLTLNPEKILLRSDMYYKNRLCYVNKDYNDVSELFDDILSNKRKPKKGKTIFFHETSCSKTGYLKLNARQGCAIESAALLNPNFDIFVLFASPIALNNDFQSETQSENDFHIHRTLKQYKNIYFRNVNLSKYAFGTPIYDWFADGQLFISNYVVDHVSDLLRFLTLWRWGGTHLDLDIILIQTLENIESNFVVAETSKYVACGVLNIDFDGIGHEIADILLKRFQHNFSPNDRSSIGPHLITAVLQEICKTSNTKLMTRNRCSGFEVYNKEAFYAIYWEHSEYFFNEKYLNITLSLTKDSIGIHVWNRMSKRFRVKVGSKVAYGVYAEKFCPKVYSSCGNFF